MTVKKATAATTYRLASTITPNGKPLRYTFPKSREGLNKAFATAKLNGGNYRITCGDELVATGTV